MILDELLVCPVCHCELPLDAIRRDSKGNCASCDRTFNYRDGIFDMTPVPPPDSDMLSKWSLWEQLQENGLKSYELCPEASCSTSGRADVVAWKEFLSLTPNSCVLDIGCGPLGMPEYLSGWSGVQTIGIDPLQPNKASPEMPFVKGIGEYLPFRNQTFDNIILATTLDHVLSQARVLSESRRCLKPSGRVLIWFSPTDIKPPSALPNLMQKALRVGNRCIRFLKPSPSSPEPFWQWLNRQLEVPKGAIDPYHFQHFDSADLQHLCSLLKLKVTRSLLYSRDSVFAELLPEKEN